jgi:hypothetical protein
MQVDDNDSASDLLSRVPVAPTATTANKSSVVDVSSDSDKDVDSDESEPAGEAPEESAEAELGKFMP